MMEQTHIGRSGRRFELHEPKACYHLPKSKQYILPPSTIKQLGTESRSLVCSTTVAAKDAEAITVPSGMIFRLSIPEDTQVADVNVWNLENPAEHFYASKTRQLHASHLTTGDSLWSCMPYIRPMATIIGDSINYGIDKDNAGVHDVIGSRCDPYTHFMMTGETFNHCCHSNLTRAVRKYGLEESAVHDVFNVFMCTGFQPDTGVYFAKPSPAQKGDYLEFYAHLDLIVAVSTCPQGSVATACGEGYPKCYPLEMEVWKPGEKVEVVGSRVSEYGGRHGL